MHFFGLPFLALLWRPRPRKWGLEADPKSSKKSMKNCIVFRCIFEWILDAKMKPTSMPKPVPKWVEFLIDFWRFLGYQNEAQMAMKSVPNPIVFWSILGFIFGLIFGSPPEPPEPQFWCSRVGPVHFFTFSLCRKRYQKWCPKPSKIEAFGMPNVFKNPSKHH